MLAEPLSLHHTVTSFLNSLFLEYRDFRISENEISFPLSEDTHIAIPLKKHSLLGRHQYQGKFFLITLKGKREIVFFELISLICEHLAVKLNTPSDQKNAFIKRVMNSAFNIKQFLELRETDLREFLHVKKNFKLAEQALILGHAFHPTPKSRSEFSENDARKYSPEAGGSFPLEWVLLDPKIFFQKTSTNFKHEEWLKELFSAEFDSANEIKDGYIPYPLHPWQKNFILQNEDIKDYIKDEKIIEVGPGKVSWYPTSSLRTLYTEQSAFMLKFSLNVKLTNSTRHLFLHELERGLQVHDVFSHKLGQKFNEENPQFSVIHEPVFAGIKSKDGSPLQESLIMGRINPFQKDTEAVVVATLTEMNAIEGRSLISKYLEDSEFSQKLWFKEFLEVAIKPLILAQANYGILLGSHQQNMILELKENRPYRSYFRDCHGTGYSKLGYENFGKDIPSIDKSNGNVLMGEEANFLFGYYLMINTTFNVMSAIAEESAEEERELIHELREFLHSLKKLGPKDSTFIDYLLYNETLMHKGNFFCSFNNINENTEESPLSIYTQIKNPLHIRSGL